MSQHRIAVLVGSLRRASFNAKLADAVEKLAPPSLAFTRVPIGDLPLYDQDADRTPPESVKRLKASIASASGVLFVTPEYNRSIPGVLKNAIDHASRPYGESSWTGKPAGILGVSLGPIGTALAQQHLRNVLAYLDVPTLGQPEMFLQSSKLFKESGELDSSAEALLEQWIARYAAWVAKHAG